ncbi:MAG TPA: hypothetical protein VFU82_04760 [Gammaproteobacteria bacterium]|nr:hypothetical protein [Gammaproteobacteria bacterium]
MKTLAIAVLAALSITSAYADTGAKMKINIQDAVNNNHYYVCVYGSGCYNIKELDGKSFPVMPDNLANDTKIAVLDTTNFKMSTEANTACQVNDAAGKTVTINGKLTMKNGEPYINQLSCHVG